MVFLGVGEVGYINTLCLEQGHAFDQTKTLISLTLTDIHQPLINHMM